MLSAIFHTRSSLSDSQGKEGARPKRRKIQPTKRLPPPTAQRGAAEVPGDEMNGRGPTAGNVACRSVLSPLPCVTAIADSLVKALQRSPHHSLPPTLSWNRKNRPAPQNVSAWKCRWRFPFVISKQDVAKIEFRTHAIILVYTLEHSIVVAVTRPHRHLPLLHIHVSTPCCQPCIVLHQ